MHCGVSDREILVIAERGQHRVTGGHEAAGVPQHAACGARATVAHESRQKVMYAYVNTHKTNQCLSTTKNETHKQKPTDRLCRNTKQHPLEVQKRVAAHLSPAIKTSNIGTNPQLA